MNRCESYRFDGRRIEISDPELGLELSLPFAPRSIQEGNGNGRQLQREYRSERLMCLFFLYEGLLDGEMVEFYPGGQLAARSFYRKGLLEGPSLHYTPDGLLLCESWFIEGSLEGKRWKYGRHGALLSIERFQKGVPVGSQQFFHRNGSLRSELFLSDQEIAMLFLDQKGAIENTSASMPLWNEEELQRYM